MRAPPAPPACEPRPHRQPTSSRRSHRPLPPPAVAITNGARRVEIRNFLGEKVVRIVEGPEGITVKRSSDVKDQITIEGNDIQEVSRVCALIQQCCAVKHKDIRKFLDGIYVSHKGTVVTE